jgi:hypothetical protein
MLFRDIGLLKMNQIIAGVGQPLVYIAGAD